MNCLYEYINTGRLLFEKFALGMLKDERCAGRLANRYF